MNQSLDRGVLLFQQSRYELAEQEFRRMLGENPNDPAAHAFLGLCLEHQEKFDEAQRVAEQAIALAPGWAFTHSCRSQVMENRRQFSEAEKSAREAVRLDPQNADYWARLAATLFRQEKWKDAYEAAMKGLEHDPENSGCTHLRTMALTKLGRQKDAVASVDAALARDPDDAFAHTNKGWAVLHEGKPRDALVHFREALRLDPTSDYAKAGIVEALKARNPLYRWMLAYFLWMARLSNGARWGVILGGYIGARFLRTVARNNPALEPWVWPLLIVYLVFVLLTWFAYPLFNLLLRFNKFGWYALSHDQRAASNWFGGCLALLAVAVAAYFATGSVVALVTAGFSVGMALPLVTIYSCNVGWPRKAMSAFAGAMAVVGLTAIVLTALQQPSMTISLGIFIFGFIATPWLANYLVTVVVTR